MYTIKMRRDHHNSSGNEVSRFAMRVIYNKINVLLCFCGIAVFFFFVFLYQMYTLPGKVITGEGKIFKKRVEEKNSQLVSFGESLEFLKELDFGDDIKFEPSKKLLAEFKRNAVDSRKAVDGNVHRFGYREPKLAMVFPDLSVNPYQIQMLSIAIALQQIGYEIEVLSMEDGPVRAVWLENHFPLHIITADENSIFSVDWLNYNCIFLNSLESAGALSSLMQEPFRSIPLIWTIHEKVLAARLRRYVSTGQNELVDNWRKLFRRARVVVFPNYILPMAYSACDPGKFIVIPGSPTEAWEADNFMVLHKESLSPMSNHGPDDLVVAIVGSQLLYKGLWLDHALVLYALHPLLTDIRGVNGSSHYLKVNILAGHSTSTYSRIVDIIARNLQYPNETVKHVGLDDEEADYVLSMANVVIYGSFYEEQSLPEILVKAMCFGKPIIAPDLAIIRKYIEERMNCYIFPKEDIEVMEILLRMVLTEKASPLYSNSASAVKEHAARNLMASESVEGYASLMENLGLPSGVIPEEISNENIYSWQWSSFQTIPNTHARDKTWRINRLLDSVEKNFIKHTQRDSSMDLLATMNETSSLYSIWEDQEHIDMAALRKQREHEELRDRTNHCRRTWDKVYRKAKKVDKLLHVRDDGELERIGQPLCIYEPYFGEGTWPFLHRSSSLYRGISLSKKGRRHGTDDVDAPSRLPLLNDPYYRDILGEFGAFFVIANRIDHLHKNAWIGFQSWRATARKQSLSKKAERSLLDAIEEQRHGDVMYFWSRLDMDPRNLHEYDFWSFCDAMNAGHCRFAFTEAFKNMYGIKNHISLPRMPKVEGNSWSVEHCWVMPTRSFLEFVMFTRMFVDALDAQLYAEQNTTTHCYLSISEDKHCYSRMLELIVNVWAYHSARRMVYIDPETGLMQRQHKLRTRRGQMWIKWFRFGTLKRMDMDLAEEFDLDRPSNHWLWPKTGEVFWKGLYEREKYQRRKEREKNRERRMERNRRMRKKGHPQKPLGRYIKPEGNDTNSTKPAANPWK